MPDTIEFPDDIPLGALTSIIFRTRFIILNQRLKFAGLSAGQFPVMMYLHKNQDITQETLARHFHIDRGTIARAVKKLEDSGYITRITDTDNRRAVRLFLTEKGKEITPALMQIDKEWEKIATSNLTDQEIVQYKNIMIKIATAGLQSIRESGEVDYGSFCKSGAGRS